MGGQLQTMSTARPENSVLDVRSPERRESAIGSILEQLGSDRALLAAGIVLRIVAFKFLPPFNNDAGHLLTIDYIVQHHALPPVTQNPEAFQPPLYYLIAAAFYSVVRNFKFVQLFSLELSVLTLLLFHRLIYREELIAGHEARRCAFFLVCFLPEFVLFGLYVTNDTLAIFLGVLVVLQALRFIAQPNNSQLVLLAVVLGAGLLTKATFLAFAPVLFCLVMFIRARRGQAWLKTLPAAIVFLVLSCGLGSYGFIRNYSEVKNPFASNLNLGYSWVAKAERSYHGPSSFFDFNLLKLLSSPTVTPATRGAYPVMLYGTFWYRYIPEPNFAGSRRAPSEYLGLLIYLFALIPSLAFLVGLVVWLKGLPRFLFRCDPLGKKDQQRLASSVSVCLLLANLGLIVAVALRYPVWVLWQGRLLFPAFFGFLVLFDEGIGALSGRRTLRAAFRISLAALAVCFLVYFASEIYLALCSC